MRSFEIDWRHFFDALPVYRQLSLPAREAFLRNPFNQSVPLAGMSEQSPFRELIHHGLYVPKAKGAHVSLAPSYHAFLKAMRSMHRNLLDTPTTRTFDRYVVDNFISEEWNSFHSGQWWRQSREGLYAKIASVEWIEQFLKSDAASWKQQYRMQFDSNTNSPESDDALKTIVKRLTEIPEPIPFEALDELCPNRTLLAIAIRTGFRYMLLFPRLSFPGLDPLIGLWPGISRRMHRHELKPPAPVTAVQSFCTPLVIDSMAAILTACIAEPLRILRGSWGELYAKSQKQVIARMIELPDWLPDELRMNYADRIDLGMHMLRNFHMITDDEMHSTGRHYDVTKSGRDWLAMPAKQRLKTVLDRFRNFKRYKDDTFAREWEEFAEPIRFQGGNIDASTAVREAFARIAPQTAVDLEEFIIYESRVQNPLMKVPKGRLQRINTWSTHLDDTSEDDLEQYWADVLLRAFERHLLPLGAVELGVAENRRLTIALSEPGSYLLRRADDFSIPTAEAPAAIVVQPNFDIVFMAPSLHAEAELSSFTERQGKHVGAVLKITKKSVWAAAAAGITADSVIEALRTHSSVPVPSNVEREIRGWMNQCRRASLRPAMIIHCPDAETATRILALERTKLEKLTDTVLELNDPNYKSKLVKKLREIGIFI